ncbi:hypothetical protein NHX12_024263 [Muraenolepis orangiensis]|uniref:Uncharacterized protein n=1 Tax=Muraenolepis orangiensis TaxID=630683 RepID=A0A9Q0ESE9_9TELE|nr:hypothetical protein NHX12_024263 [Muraenolepis orangiensis]
MARSDVAEPDRGTAEGSSVPGLDPTSPLLSPEDALPGGVGGRLQRALERMLVSVAETSDQVGNTLERPGRNPDTPRPSLATAVHCVVVLFIIFFYYAVF